LKLALDVEQLKRLFTELRGVALPEWLPEEIRSLRRAFFTLPRHLGELSGLKRYLPDLIAASMVLNLLGLALPFTLLQVYDRIIPNSATDTLTALAIGIVVAVTLESMLRVTRSAVTGWTSGRFEHLATSRAFKSLLHCPLDAFERKGTGAHLEALNAIHTLKEFYSGQAYLAVFDLPFAVLFLTLMTLFGGLLVLVPLGLMVAFSVAGLVVGRRMHEAIANRMKCDDSRVNFVVEILTGIQTIKTFGMEAQMARRHERLLETSAQADFTVTEMAAKAQSLALLFSHLTTILVVTFGSIAVIDGRMTTGVLAACSLLAGRCIQPMQAALDRWTRFQTARLAEQRLSDILTGEDSDAIETLATENEGAAELRLEAVDLHFKDGKAVLNAIDLTVAAGEMIGVSGENASGKSSLLSVMAGMTAPTAGRVLIDGVDAARQSAEALHQAVAYIPQRPELFRGTILENLTMFAPERTAKAKELARDLGVEKFVSRLPLGYDSQIGDGAQEALPRGVRQLVAIVRALAAEPRIILFDEANTAVDGAGDQAIRAAFERLKGKATVVLITSRPSMLSLADRKFKLLDGQVVDASTAAAQRPPEPIALAQVAALQNVATSTSANTHQRSSLATETRSDLLSEVESASTFGRCLSSLLTAMRWTGDARHFAEAMPHFQNTLDTVAFRNVMAHLGYTNDAQEWRGEHVDNRVLPCLFVDAEGNPTVLSDGGAEGVLSFDPVTGITTAVDSASLFGSAYFFSPIEPPVQGSWFRQILNRFHGLLWALLGQSLIINLLSLGVPFFTMAVYDKVIGSGDIAMLLAFLVGALIVIAGDEVLRELRAKASAYVGARISYIVTSMVFERTLLLPLSLTERASIGSQLARFKDLESFRDFFGGGIALVIIDLPFVVLYLVVLMMLGGVVAAVPVVALAIFAVTVAALMPVVRRRVATAGRAATRRQEFVVESLLKMRALRQVGMEAAWAERFRNIAAQAAMGGYESSLVSGGLATLSQAMVVLSGMATMTVGVFLVVGGSMTPGALIASMMVVWRILAPIQTGFSLVQRVEQTRSSIRQLEALTGFRTEIDGRPTSSTGLVLTGAVTFARVSLRYSNDADPALLGVSFEAKPGEVVAIVGADGAGKSTVLKLIAGLYAPQAGNVMIDDLDIRQIDPIELRKAIGYAPQVPQLFFGTIAQNLRLAQPTATDADLREALALAGVWQEVAQLPQGLGTRVGDAASNRISTSLTQGISLARAYLKKSPLLLLDEPVTGLDFEGDRCFREFVEAMRGKATILMVTHRPSHLSLADQIVVLDKGAVRAAGPAADIRAKLA